MSIEACGFCGESLPAPESKGDGYVNHTCGGCNRLYTAYVADGRGRVEIPLINRSGVVGSPPNAWQHQYVHNDEPGIRHGVDKEGVTYTAIDSQKVDQFAASKCGHLIKVRSVEG